MKQTFNLVFDHCIEDKEFDNLPSYPGIYIFRVTTRNLDKSYNPKIVYIGKADQENGLKGRVNDQHEHLDDARKLVKKAQEAGEKAFLTIAYTDENPDLEKNDWIARVEAALIYAKQPEINTAGRDSFNYDETELNVSGKYHGGLNSFYDVKPSLNQ